MGDRERMRQAFIKIWVEERTQEHDLTEREVWWLVVENTGRRWTRQESVRERVRKGRMIAGGVAR